VKLHSLARWSPLLLAMGLTIWVVSWALNGRTLDGSVSVLGMSERGWRRLLDPGTLFLMAGLLGFHTRRRHTYGRLGLIGFVTIQVGLFIALTGNVIEFWVGGWLYVDGPGFEPTDFLGWQVFLIGVLIALAGLVIFAIALLARRWDPADAT